MCGGVLGNTKSFCSEDATDPKGRFASLRATLCCLETQAENDDKYAGIAHLKEAPQGNRLIQISNPISWLTWATKCENAPKYFPFSDDSCLTVGEILHFVVYLKYQQGRGSHGSQISKHCKSKAKREESLEFYQRFKLESGPFFFLISWGP